jgi:NAD(P)-dependent dehydrogenase (short-subunit alcohol dehydrogenase family)
MKLKNKIAAITGASGGMGKEISLLFAKEGADIAAIDIKPEKFEETKKEIESLGRKVKTYKLDVTKEKDVNECFKKVKNDFGRIDILLNGAGVLGNVRFAVDEDGDAWDYCMDINGKGVWLCSLASARIMIADIKAKKQERAKVVNIASMVGRTGMATAAAYCASKFAVVGLTQSFAREWGEYKINVNAVCPGIVVTDMFYDEWTQAAKLFGKKDMWEAANDVKNKEVALKEFVYPKDVAYLCLYFASDDSNIVTGQSLNICGGHIML